MARVKNVSTPVAPGTPPVVVVQENEENGQNYGLSVGPAGSFNRGMKHAKWGHVFGVDKEGKSALLEIYQYVLEGHPDPTGITNGVEEFIKQYQASKKAA
jgi:hypothetical protein